MMAILMIQLDCIPDIQDNGNDWNASMKYLPENEVDIMGFAETNIHWNPTHIKSAQQNTIGYYKKNSTSTSSSIDTNASYHQQGGTATIITNNHVGRTVSTFNDSTGLGRWSGFKLRKTRNKTSIHYHSLLSTRRLKIRDRYMLSAIMENFKGSKPNKSGAQKTDVVRPQERNQNNSRQER